MTLFLTIFLFQNDKSSYLLGYNLQFLWNLWAFKAISEQNMGLERHTKHEEVNSSIENLWLRGICSSRRSMQVQICKENRPGAMRGLKDLSLLPPGAATATYPR